MKGATLRPSSDKRGIVVRLDLMYERLKSCARLKRKRKTIPKRKESGWKMLGLDGYQKVSCV